MVCTGCNLKYSYMSYVLILVLKLIQDVARAKQSALIINAAHCKAQGLNPSSFGQLDRMLRESVDAVGPYIFTSQFTPAENADTGEVILLDGTHTANQRLLYTSVNK